MRRGGLDRRRNRGNLWLIVLLILITVMNYVFWIGMRSPTTEPTDAPTPKVDATLPPRVKQPLVKKPPVTEQPPVPTPSPDGPVIDIERPGDVKLETPKKSADPKPDRKEDNVDDATDPPDTQLNHAVYEDALAQFSRNLDVKLGSLPNEVTKNFTDVHALHDHGVLLPHDPSKATAHLHVHCDPRNASFSPERDKLCQDYLSNVHNMRSIKAMDAILDSGRTIKYRLFYHNANLTAVVKISQEKFFFESASEYLAFLLDRTLGLNRVPTTAYVQLPLDYMRAASGIMGPFFSQWFNNFVPKYDLTKNNMVRCDTPDRENSCSLAAVQLWMSDVHAAVMSQFRMSYYKPDERFIDKYYNPATTHRKEKKPHKLMSAAELNDRFIFDFLIGNTDRGMNDHNNFIYGGCDSHTQCSKEPEGERTLYKPKLAFIDHGSSFHSHKEPEGNPFTGDSKVCKFRKSTYDSLDRFRRHDGASQHYRPLMDGMKPRLAKGLFRVIHQSIYKKMQDRLDKVMSLADACIKKHGSDEVLSLVEYKP